MKPGSGPAARNEFSGELMSDAVFQLDELCSEMRQEKARLRNRTRSYSEILIVSSSAFTDNFEKTGLFDRERGGWQSVGVDVPEKFARFLESFSETYRECLELQRKISEQESRANVIRIMSGFAGKISEVKKQLEKEPPALQQSVESESAASFRPVFSIYEHNFDARYFRSGMISIDSRFLAQFVSRLATARSCAEMVKVLKTTLADVDGMIPELIRMRNSAMEAYEFMSVVCEVPERRIVEGSDTYCKLAAVAEKLEEKVRAWSSFRRMKDVSDRCMAYIGLLDQFGKAFQENTSECAALEAQREALECRLRIFQGVREMLSSAKRFDGALRQSFLETVNAVNGLVPVLTGECSTQDLEKVHREMDRNVSAIDAIQQQVQRYKLDRENVCQHLRTTNYKPEEGAAELSVEVEGKRKEVRDMMTQVATTLEAKVERIATVQQVAERAIAKTSLREATSGILEMGRLTVNKHASEVKWRRQVIERLQELAKEKRARLAEVQARIATLKKEVGK